MVFLMIHRESTSGAYYLKTEAGGVAHTYCHMEDIPGCGSGGWTLVMKIDGEKVTFPLIWITMWSNMDASLFRFENNLQF